MMSELRKLCRKCSQGHHSAAAFLVTCRYCQRHWHHSCLEPRMGEEELIAIIQGLKEDPPRDIWSCRRCFLRHGEKSKEVKGTTQLPIAISVDFASGPSDAPPPNVSNALKSARKRSTAAIELLSDDDADDDIEVISPSRDDHVKEHSSNTLPTTSRSQSTTVTDSNRHIGPPSQPIRHINFLAMEQARSHPGPSSRRKLPADKRTASAEHTLDIIELDDDDDMVSVSDGAPDPISRPLVSSPTSTAPRSRSSSQILPPKGTASSGDRQTDRHQQTDGAATTTKPSYSTYQSPLGPRRTVQTSSVTTTSRETSTSTAGASSSGSTPEPRDPAASSSSLNASFVGMHLNPRPTNSTPTLTHPLPPRPPSPWSHQRSAAPSRSGPPPRSKAWLAGETSEPAPSEPAPFQMPDFRAQIAQMRAAGLIRPPPSALDYIQRDPSPQAPPPPSPPRDTSEVSQNEVDAVVVKLETRDSDDEGLPRRSTVAGMGTQPRRHVGNASPLLQRIEREKTGGDEKDDWDALLDSVEARVARRREDGIILPRKPTEGDVKKLGPRGKAKRDEKGLQWVNPDVDLLTRRLALPPARKVPTWML